MSLVNYFLIIFLQILRFSQSWAKTKPHIILMLIDDMGWNDIGFHGSTQIPTPNIDALAYNGIILNQHYVQALCTPSRAALMTGKYPIHTGMQHLVILEAEPWGLPLKEKILPQYLKEAGYSTHAIGKWHLGFFRKEYTPTYRGFDTHYGYWNGLQDYFNQSVKASFQPYYGLDMRRNMLIENTTSKNAYSTDLYTQEAVKLISKHDKSKPMFMYLAHLAVHSGNTYDPFQAPDEEVGKFLHIADPERRTYAGMVTRLDQSVGQVVTALRRNNMLENSVILFLSDNGAPTFGIHGNKGSNYPLRGMKLTYFEGGIRGVAAVWSPLFKDTQKVSSELFHITDWLPTLLSAAGLTANLTGIDGHDQWKTLTEGEKSPRTEIVLNIDDLDPYEAVRSNDIKYLKGAFAASDWYGEHEEKDYQYQIKDIMNSKVAYAINGYKTKLEINRIRSQPTNSSQNLTESQRGLLMEETIYNLRQKAKVNCTYEKTVTPCNSKLKACLFNITEDPCEQNNLAEVQTELLKEMEELIEKYKTTMLPPGNKPNDERANPIHWNNVWVNWYDELDKHEHQGTLNTIEIVLFIIIIIALTIGIVIGLIKKYLKHNERVVNINEVIENTKAMEYNKPNDNLKFQQNQNTNSHQNNTELKSNTTNISYENPACVIEDI